MGLALPIPYNKMLCNEANHDRNELTHCAKYQHCTKTDCTQFFPRSNCSMVVSFISTWREETSLA